MPTIVLFAMLGVPSSAAAVAPPLLPPFYAAIGPWLPDWAFTQTIRDIVYFPGNPHLRPVLVLAAWLVATLAAVILISRLRRRFRRAREPRP